MRQNVILISLNAIVKKLSILKEGKCYSNIRNNNLFIIINNKFYYYTTIMIRNSSVKWCQPIKVKKAIFIGRLTDT